MNSLRDQPVRAAEGVTCRADEEGGATNCPFVTMPLVSRVGLLWLGSIYALIVCVGPLVMDQGSVASPLLALSTGLHLAVLFYPLASIKRDCGWFHPLIFTSLMAFLNVTMRKTGLFLYGMDEHVALPGMSHGELTMLVAYENVCNALALLATYVGYFFGPKVRVPSLRFVTSQGLTTVLIITVAISCVALSLLLTVSGGLYGHTLNMARGSATRQYESELVGTGQFELTITLAVPAALIMLAYQHGKLQNPMMLAISGAALFLSFMATGRRSGIVYPLIMGLMVWMMCRRRIPYVRLLLLLMACMFLFGFIGLWRSSVWKSDALDQNFASEYSPIDVLDRGFSEVQARSGSSSSIYPVLALVPSEVDFLYGRSFLQNFQRFVPRMFWPDKPRGIDTEVAEIFYGANWAIPLGAIGEAYWNFHLPGVVGIFFMVGALYSWLGRFMVRYSGQPAAVVFYATSLFLFNPSQTGFKNWLFVFVPTVIILTLCGCVRFGRR